MYASTARCDRIAALGRPVVPLVNNSSKGSSSSISTSGSSVTPTTGTEPQSRSITSVRVASARPSRRAWRFSSMISRLGAVNSIALRISGPVHQPFIATSTASSTAQAQKVRIHSGQFAAQIATRSPLPIPKRSRRPAATSATSVTRPVNVWRRPSDHTYRSPSPYCSAPNRSCSRKFACRSANTGIRSPSTSSSITSKGAPGAVNAALASTILASRGSLLRELVIVARGSLGGGFGQGHARAVKVLRARHDQFVAHRQRER